MDKSTKDNNIDQTRRDFVKKAAYATPAIVTMAAIPSFASAGSVQPIRASRNLDRERARSGNLNLTPNSE